MKKTAAPRPYLQPQAHLLDPGYLCQGTAEGPGLSSSNGRRMTMQSCRETNGQRNKSGGGALSVAEVQVLLQRERRKRQVAPAKTASPTRRWVGGCHILSHTRSARKRTACVYATAAAACASLLTDLTHEHSD